MNGPATRYAKSGDVHIAYQITGGGPIDLVLIPGFVSHLELDWEEPATVHMLERLGSFTRLIRFDKRGTGMSDRGQIATTEERMDDIRAVMDASGSDRAALLGISEGGSMSLLFAATYPDRLSGIVLYGAFAKRLWSTDYPIGVPDADRRTYLELIENQWSEDADLSVIAPSLASDPARAERFAASRRLSASPGAALAIARMNSEIDVRHVLSSIQVPTLILHRSSDQDVAVENGRYLAKYIAGAKYVEFPTGDHLPTTGNSDEILDEIEAFLTGVKRGPDPDRILATLLFTDVVASTDRAAELGDQKWAELIAAHHSLIRHELARFGGQEIDTAGDGFFAIFEGPTRAIRCAIAITRGVNSIGVQVRSGLHAGEVQRREHDVTGLAVHIGARVSSLANPGEVLVTSTVKDLVAGADIEFEDRGEHELKGVPSRWQVFAAIP